MEGYVPIVTVIIIIIIIKRTIIASTAATVLLFVYYLPELKNGDDFFTQPSRIMEPCTDYFLPAFMPHYAANIS